MNRKNAVDNIDKKNNISSIKKVAFIIACLLIIVFIVSLFYDPLNIYSNNTNSFAESIEIKPDQPIFNYTNKQIIPLQDLNINWQECKNTNKYIYKVIIIDGEPKNVNNEASMLGSISLAENLEGTTERNININQDNLMKDVWVKIAVAACNDKIQTWNSIYIYID